MGRYIKEIKLGQPIDVVSMVMEDYTFHQKFRRNDWNGEMVFATTDKWGAVRYLKWSYAGGILRLEAWIKGLAGGEVGLNGVYKSSSCSDYKNSLSQLERKVREHCGHVKTGLIGQDPLGHSGEHHDKHNPNEAYKNSVGYQYSYGKKASPEETKAILIAIFAFLFAMVPVVGFVLGIYGIMMSKHVTQPNIRKVVRAVCILGIVGGILLSPFFRILLQLLW